MCLTVGLILLGVGPVVLLATGLYLHFIVDRMRGSMSRQVLEAIQPAIEAAITRQDDRIEKRAVRRTPTPSDNPGRAEEWEGQVSQVQAGVPYTGELER